MDAFRHRLVARSSLVSVPGASTHCFVWPTATISVDNWPVPVARAAYSHFIGHVPAGQYVLRKCDTPNCWRPDHLYISKTKRRPETCTGSGSFVSPLLGRRRPDIAGSNNRNAKLTEKMAAMIRDDPRRQVVVARAYGVSQPVVSAIKRKAAWRHAR